MYIYIYTYVIYEYRGITKGVTTPRLTTAQLFNRVSWQPVAWCALGRGRLQKGSKSPIQTWWWCRWSVAYYLQIISLKRKTVTSTSQPWSASPENLSDWDNKNRFWILILVETALKDPMQRGSLDFVHWVQQLSLQWNSTWGRPQKVPGRCPRLPISDRFRNTANEIQRRWQTMLVEIPIKMVNCLVVWTPLKNMKVSWDDDIPNIWENKIDVPNHQTVKSSITVLFNFSRSLLFYPRAFINDDLFEGTQQKAPKLLHLYHMGLSILIIFKEVKTAENIGTKDCVDT